MNHTIERHRDEMVQELAADYVDGLSYNDLWCIAFELEYEDLNSKSLADLKRMYLEYCQRKKDLEAQHEEI